MAQQTAIQWLMEEYIKDPYDCLIKKGLFEQAKAMEKEHIMMAYDYGEANEFRQNIYQCSDDDVSPEQYYNKTYNK